MANWPSWISRSPRSKRSSVISEHFLQNYSVCHLHSRYISSAKGVIETKITEVKNVVTFLQNVAIAEGLCPALQCIRLFDSFKSRGRNDVKKFWLLSFGMQDLCSVGILERDVQHASLDQKSFFLHSDHSLLL